MSIMSKTDSTLCAVESYCRKGDNIRVKSGSTFSVHLLMTSDVKWGSCFIKESLLHLAWVTICASSMAVRAGESQPLLLSTSTQAWMRRSTCEEEEEEEEEDRP